MDSIKIETFLLVAKEKSFTKAAEKSLMTPAAIKKQIDSLEEELEAQLFYRSPTGCILTNSGEVFEKQAKKIVSLINETKTKLRTAEISDFQEIRVGHSLRFVYNFISGLCNRYADANPKSQLTLQRMKVNELQTALLNNELDCFLIINPHIKELNYFEHTKVGECAIHAVMRKKHPLANRDIITADDLLPYNIVFSNVIGLSLYDTLKKQLHNSIDVIDKMDRNDIVYFLRRNGIVLYPCKVHHDQSIPFEYPPLDIYLYYQKKDATKVKPLIQFLSEMFAQNKSITML